MIYWENPLHKLFQRQMLFLGLHLGYEQIFIITLLLKENVYPVQKHVYVEIKEYY